MLASTTVDSLFARLLVRYGSAWTARWDGVPAEALRYDWARELGLLRKDALLYGLANLPNDWPPTVIQFRDICLRAPEHLAPQLPAPKADPVRVAEAVGRIGKSERRDPKQWAWDLKARHEGGEPVPFAHVVMYRVVTQRLTPESEEQA